MASFEAVADQYDAARPAYPEEIFDALGPLAGFRVLDVGAGTGIASRALIARHADVVAIDPGREVLRRASRTPPISAPSSPTAPRFPWIRDTPLDIWMTDQASHSYIVGLPHDERDRLLTELREIALSRFCDGTMVVPYETWLWIATRI